MHTTFVLTESLLKRLKKRLQVETLHCALCLIPLKPGDKVVSIFHKRRRYFHEQCLEGLYQ